MNRVANSVQRRVADEWTIESASTHRDVSLDGAATTRPMIARWRTHAREASFRASSLLLGLGVLGFGFWFASSPSSSPLRAQPGVTQPGVDADADGLADSLEAQFGGSNSSRDSDGDGVEDMIEAILGTDPIDSASVPDAAAIATPSVRVLGYIEGESFHLHVSVYVPNGDVLEIANPLGLLYAPDFFGQGPAALDLTDPILSGWIAQQNFEGGSIAVSSDSWFPVSAVNLFSSFDGYSQFTVAFSATVAGSTYSSVAMFTTTSVGDTDGTSLSYMPVAPGGGGAGSFRPLKVVMLPPGYAPDMVCMITNQVVAVEPPAILVLETTTADCMPLAGALCSPVACDSQVGRTLRTIDPLALVGGGN